jgi:hypothetical protein
VSRTPIRAPLRARIHIPPAQSRFRDMRVVITERLHVGAVTRTVAAPTESVACATRRAWHGACSPRATEEIRRRSPMKKIRTSLACAVFCGTTATSSTS